MRNAAHAQQPALLQGIVVEQAVADELGLEKHRRRDRIDDFINESSEGNRQQAIYSKRKDLTPIRARYELLMLRLFNRVPQIA
jgi:hypothetical protein